MSSHSSPSDEDHPEEKYHSASGFLMTKRGISILGSFLIGLVLLCQLPGLVAKHKQAKAHQAAYKVLTAQCPRTLSRGRQVCMFSTQIQWMEMVNLQEHNEGDHLCAYPGPEKGGYTALYEEANKPGVQHYTGKLDAGVKVGRWGFQFLDDGFQTVTVFTRPQGDTCPEDLPP